MFTYQTEKQLLYYNRIIQLRTEKGLSIRQLCRLFPVSDSTIKRWLRNYDEENLRKGPKAMPKSPGNRSSSVPKTAESELVRTLREENARLKAQAAKESMRADAYEEMINIAERRFNIPIRKKRGAKQ